jgi:hypothetical protein
MVVVLCVTRSERVALKFFIDTAEFEAEVESCQKAVGKPIVKVRVPSGIHNLPNRFSSCCVVLALSLSACVRETVAMMCICDLLIYCSRLSSRKTQFSVLGSFQLLSGCAMGCGLLPGCS